MTGWDQTTTVRLMAPWDAYTVTVYNDPPIGAYIDMKAAVNAAAADFSPESLEACLVTIRPLIASHTIADRDGEPLELTVRSLTGKLFQAICLAVGSGIEGRADPDPLATGRSSRRSRADARRRPTSASSS